MNESKATRYQRLRRRTRVAGVVSATAMLAAISVPPVSSWLVGVALYVAQDIPAPLHVGAALVVFVTLVVALWEMAALPSALYLSLGVDAAYGRTAPTLEEALLAQLHALGVVLPSAYLAAGVVLATRATVGGAWWLVASLCLSGAVVGATYGLPTLLARVQVVRPVTRSRLRIRLVELSTQARITLAGVDEWLAADEATALIVGVGRSKRVCLSSALVADWSDDEIAVVVAHELAHHAHGDMWRTLAADWAVMASALWLAGVVAGRLVGGPVTLERELALLPILATVAALAWVAATPLRHAQSRRHERRADRFALDLTGRAEAFGAAVRRLAARHLAEEHPSRVTRWLFHHHPSVSERLALADAYLQGSGRRTIS